MMISFHFPPIAANAAVSGQSLTGFRRLVRLGVTCRCVLASTRPPGYDAKRYEMDSMHRRGRAAITPRPRTGWRTARLRFRDRRLEGSCVAARSSTDRFLDVVELRRYIRRAQGLEWSSQSWRARGRGSRRPDRGSEPPALQRA